MPKVSVIIPVRNIKKYLRKCLDSIINQTFQDIEIICINDGSTDGSLKILNEYAQNDNRIIVISQENSGVSAARNVGLEKAQGKYIQFVDGDDWLEKDCIELAYNKITQDDFDIVIFNYNNILKNEIKPNKSTLEILQYYENKSVNLLEVNALIYIVCDKMYKKSFLTDNNINFPINIKNSEDVYFNLLATYHSPKCSCLPQALYNYTRNRKNSETNKPLQLINNQAKAMFKFIQTNEFQNMIPELKIFTINTFLEGFIFYYKQKANKYCKFIYNYQISESLKKLATLVDNNLLNYTDYHCIQKQYDINTFCKEHIFSVTNSINNYMKYKNIKIFGLKLSFKINQDKRTIKKFKNNIIKPHTILIIEANSCHCETIPHFIKYFSLLGYNVEVMVTIYAYNEKPFCRIESKFPFKLYSMNICTIKDILSLDKISEYEYIFFNSFHLYYNIVSRYKHLSVFDFFEKITVPQHGFLALEHHLDELNKDMCKDKRILQLANLSKDAIFCNSHYFGEIKPHNKNAKTEFICVSTLVSYRKNCNILLENIAKLIKSNNTNFHITLVGQGKLYIPAELSEFITLTGRIPYDQMFDLIDKSDFLLTLFDSTHPEHLRYITSGTSGAFQLSYGFTKPIIINKDFANKHFFNSTNAILYSDNLAEKITDCINMTNEAYLDITKNLSTLQKTIEAQSLENLRKVLKYNNAIENLHHE